MKLQYYTKGKTLITAIMVFFFSMTIQGCLQAQSAEQTMKAVALEKISMFVTWPAQSANKAGGDFVIGYLNDDPMGAVVQEVYKNKKIKDKKVKVIKINYLQDMLNCNILMIPEISPHDLSKILNFIKGKPVLSISDSGGYAEAGCLVNFYEYENKLRFEINQKGMKEAGFTADYRLFRVSKVVNPIME